MMMMGQCFFFSAAVQVDGGLVLILTGVGGVRRGYSYLYSCQCEGGEGGGLCRWLGTKDRESEWDH